MRPRVPSIGSTMIAQRALGVLGAVRQHDAAARQAFGDQHDRRLTRRNPRGRRSTSTSSLTRSTA